MAVCKVGNLQCMVCFGKWSAGMKNRLFRKHTKPPLCSLEIPNTVYSNVMFSSECRIAVANASNAIFMSDFQLDCCKACVVLFFSPNPNSLKATQRVTMSSDFSDISGHAGSWKRTRPANLSLGKNIHRLAVPQGFVA